MEKDKSDNTKWKDVKKKYSDFLSAVPEANNEKVRSTLNTMLLWDFQSDLIREKRFMELVWIHPNLTEIIISSMISTHFFIVGGGKQKVHRELVESLNLQQKIRLLFSLNIIDKETYSKLESWRTQRNAFVHKLMQKVRSGADLEKESERFCKMGIELQERLHDILMEEIRNAISKKI